MAVNATNSLDLASSMQAHGSSNTVSTQEKIAYPFPETIHIKDPVSATELALKTYTQPPISRTLVIWADGSACGHFKGEPCTAAVAYNDHLSGQWETQVAVGHHSTANEAGLLAIHEAFRVAATLTEHFDRLVVFSDNRVLLENLSKSCNVVFVRDGELAEGTFRFAKCLQEREKRVELHLIPGRALVGGHRIVTRMSRQYRKLALAASPKELLEYDVSFAPIRLKPRDDRKPKKELEVLLRGCLDDARATGRVGPLRSLKHEWGFEARRLRRQAKIEYREVREREGKPLKPTDSEIAKLREQKGRPKQACTEEKEGKETPGRGDERIVGWKDLYQALAGSRWEDRRELQKLEHEDQIDVAR